MAELADYNNNTLELDTYFEKIGTIPAGTVSGVITLTCTDINRYKFIGLFIDTQTTPNNTKDYSSPLMIMNLWRNDTSKILSLLSAHSYVDTNDSSSGIKYLNYSFKYNSANSLELLKIFGLATYGSNISKDLGIANSEIAIYGIR